MTFHSCFFDDNTPSTRKRSEKVKVAYFYYLFFYFFIEVSVLDAAPIFLVHSTNRVSEVKISHTVGAGHHLFSCADLHDPSYLHLSDLKRNRHGVISPSGFRTVSKTYLSWARCEYENMIHWMSLAN